MMLLTFSLVTSQAQGARGSFNQRSFHQNAAEVIPWICEMGRKQNDYSILESADYNTYKAVEGLGTI